MDHYRKTFTAEMGAGPRSVPKEDDEPEDVPRAEPEKKKKRKNIGEKKKQTEKKTKTKTKVKSRSIVETSTSSSEGDADNLPTREYSFATPLLMRLFPVI